MLLPEIFIKFWKLKLRNKCIVIQVASFLIIFQLLFKLLGYRRVSNLVSFLANLKSRQISIHNRKLIINYIGIIGNKIPGSVCVRAALVAKLMLETKENPITIRIGIRLKKQEFLIGHAWAESNGEVLLGGEESHANFVLISNDVRTLRRFLGSKY